jgi:hypothetical protein
MRSTLRMIRSPRSIAYTGYTQGLEDSGAVPSVAANRGTILPDKISQWLSIAEGIVARLCHRSGESLLC